MFSSINDLCINAAFQGNAGWKFKDYWLLVVLIPLLVLVMLFLLDYDLPIFIQHSVIKKLSIKVDRL